MDTPTVSEDAVNAPQSILYEETEAESTRKSKPASRHRRARSRKPLPPCEAREWLTPQETALLLGCSVATVHRLRRGLMAGVDPLPCSQYGRRVVFRKSSIARWQDDQEKKVVS